MFEIEITPTLIVLFSVLIFCFLYLIIGFRHYVASVARRVTEDSDENLPETPESYPAVSVIVYSEDDAANLELLLPQILDQDYPSPMEVIVVNDGAIGATKDVIARLEQRYSNLYMTFTPMESRSLSRKKLAVTLGIKAARYETVMLTMGNCRISSPLWLRSMMRHFAQGKEVVIGYGAPCPADDAPDNWKRLRAFDTIWNATEYLSWAIAGRPYRGNCNNLAYRRSLFFKNKGFSRSLHLKFGDDDIFVNEVSTGRNTAVELSEASIVETIEQNPQVAHKHLKLRYDYTAKSLKTWARVFFGSCSLVWWMTIGCAVALSIIGWPSLVPMIASIVVLLLQCIILMISWRKTSKSLHSRSILLTFPWFMSYHPIYNFYYRIKGFVKRGQNMTWG